jgi:hypothetical protein
MYYSFHVSITKDFVNRSITMLNLIIGAFAVVFGMSVILDEFESPKRLPSPKKPMQSELDELDRMEKELRQEVEQCL